jgi:hypothetical protein
MKEKIKVYPYTQFDSEGKFLRLDANTYGPYGENKTKGGEVSEHGSVTVYLPMIEIEIEGPELAALEAKAVEILRAHKGKLQADHHLMMTKLQFIENNLLRLSAPEVLDRGEGPKGKPIDLGGPDIPF